MAHPDTDVVVCDPFFQDLVTALNSRPQPGRGQITYNFFLERLACLMHRVQALGPDGQAKVRIINEDFIKLWGQINNNNNNNNPRGVEPRPMPWRLAMFWGFIMNAMYIQPWAMHSGGNKLELLGDLRERMLEASRERVEEEEEAVMNYEALETQWMPLISKLMGGI